MCLGSHQSVARTEVLDLERIEYFRENTIGLYVRSVVGYFLSLNAYKYFFVSRLLAFPLCQRERLGLYVATLAGVSRGLKW
jgi:hypothetical protein